MNTTLNKHMEHLQLDDSLDKTREKIDFLNPIRNTHSIIQNEFDRLNLALGAIKAPQLELSSKLQATNFTSEMIKTTSEAINHGWLHSTASLRELSSSKLIATLSALGDTDSYKALSTRSIGVEFEPPRDCRRLIFLREYDNENTKLYP